MNSEVKPRRIYEGFLMIEIMAKELPYFKFEPSEWQNGNVQMLEDSMKILFLEICCTYWQRIGQLPYAFALQKHCKGNTDAIDLLIQAEVISVKEDKIVIDFLDEQINEVSEKSAKAKAAARKRWDSEQKDANAMQTHSERNANRIDKNRIDKSITSTNVEDNKTKKRFSPPSIEEVEDYFFEKNCQQYKQEASKFWYHYDANGWKVGKNKMKNWKSAASGWLTRIDNFKPKENGITKNNGESIEDYYARIRNSL